MACLKPYALIAVLVLAGWGACGAVRAGDDAPPPPADVRQAPKPRPPVEVHHAARKPPAEASHAKPLPADPHRAVKPPPAAAMHSPTPRRHHRSGCVSQRGMIAVVQAHRAVPLSAIRAEAERRGNGEIIGAELCHRGERLTYLVSVLSENGKVVHMSFDAATGRLITAAR